MYKMNGTNDIKRTKLNITNLRLIITNIYLVILFYSITVIAVLGQLTSLLVKLTLSSRFPTFIIGKRMFSV